MGIAKLTKESVQAKKDAAAVKIARQKVAGRVSKDKTTIKDDQTSVSEMEKAVAKFAESLKGKFVKIKSMASKASLKDIKIESTTSAAAKEQLATDEARITALEAAVSQFGGVKRVQAVEGAAGLPTSAQNKEVTAEKAKIKSIDKKVEKLNDNYAKASVQQNEAEMIRLGTKKKDLEEEADTVRLKLKKDYGVIVTPDPFASDNTTETVAALKAKQAALQRAVAEAKAASQARAKLIKVEEEARKKLQTSMKVEHEKIDVANNAKKGLAEEMTELKKSSIKETTNVKALRANLDAQQAVLKAQEKAAAAKRAVIRKKMAEAETVLADKQKQIKKAEAQATDSVKGSRFTAAEKASIHPKFSSKAATPKEDLVEELYN